MGFEDKSARKVSQKRNYGSPGDVAVHHVGTRGFITFDKRREEGGFVNVEEQEDKHGLHQHLEQQAEEVCPPQTSALLSRVVVERLAVLAVLQPVFALALLPVGHMQHDQQ